MVLIAVIGTWLVWFSARNQRIFYGKICEQIADERAGTAERCFDPGIIQKEGIRR